MESLQTELVVFIGFTGHLSQLTDYYCTQTSVLGHVTSQRVLTVDTPLLPDSSPCTLTAISHKPPTLLIAVPKLCRNQVKVTLRLMVSQSVKSWCRASSEAHDQRQLGLVFLGRAL
jgi:hypothetical protein